MTDSLDQPHPTPTPESEIAETTWYDEDPEVIDDEAPRHAVSRPHLARKPKKRPEPRRRFVDD
ncbi:MAG: hypothetical protein U0744_04975 [Gemmataceae bacterium]